MTTAKLTIAALICTVEDDGEHVIGVVFGFSSLAVVVVPLSLDVSQMALKFAGNGTLAGGLLPASIFLRRSPQLLSQTNAVVTLGEARMLAQLDVAKLLLPDLHEKRLAGDGSFQLSRLAHVVHVLGIHILLVSKREQHAGLALGSSDSIGRRSPPRTDSVWLKLVQQLHIFQPLLH